MKCRVSHVSHVEREIHGGNFIVLIKSVEYGRSAIFQEHKNVFMVLVT